MTRLSKYVIPGSLLLLSLLCWSGIASSAQTLEVLVKERASVQDETIYLGDVASFDPADDSRVLALKNISIGASPAPGRTLTLDNRLLIYKIGPSVKNMTDVKFKLPENLVVQREGQVVERETLRKIFKTHVLHNAPWQPDQVHFEQINVAGPVMLPRGRLEWDVKNRGGDDYIADISLVVSFTVDGKLIRKLPLTGRITVDQEVVKTAKEIKKGEVIERGDLELVSERNLRVREDIFSALSQVVGKRAARSLPSGQIVTQRAIEDPPLVQKGDRVVIKAENERLRISTFGTALEEGRKGDQVKVVNTNSGKEIFATVDSVGHVSVAF